MVSSNLSEVPIDLLIEAPNKFIRSSVQVSERLVCFGSVATRYVEVDKISNLTICKVKDLTICKVKDFWISRIAIQNHGLQSKNRGLQSTFQECFEIYL